MIDRWPLKVEGCGKSNTLRTSAGPGCPWRRRRERGQRSFHRVRHFVPPTVGSGPAGRPEQPASQHAFATVTHTAANAKLSSNFFHPGELLDFLVSQAGVIGPLLFLALFWLFWRALARGGGMQDEDRFLLPFVTPPLIISKAEIDQLFDIFTAALKSCN